MECQLDNPSTSSAVPSPDPSLHRSTPATPATPLTPAETGAGSETGLAPERGSEPAGLPYSYECPAYRCNKRFRRPSDLAKHQRCHARPFQCHDVGCTKTFSTSKDLKRHMKTHEKLEERGGYVCKVEGCGKAKKKHVYGRKDNFIRHIRKKHLGSSLDDVTDELVVW